MPRLYPRRSTLTSKDRRVVRALAEAMFAEDGDVASARLDAHVERVDELVSAASWTVRFGLRLGLFFVHLAPILFARRFAAIESLPIGERVSLLARLEHAQSNLALAFIGWRTVMTMCFYEDEGELRRIGYAGNERRRHLRIAPPLESGVRLTGAAAEERPSSPREVA